MVVGYRSPQSNGRELEMDTLGAEMQSHLLSVLVLTLLLAPLLLWRYRQAVLGGMRARPGQALPVAGPASASDRATARPPTQSETDSPLVWERGLRRRLFVAVLAAALVAALPMAVLYLWLSGLPLSPAHLLLKAGALACIAVPVHAVLTATSWWRALRTGVLTLLAMAAVFVLLTMVQRLASGRAPGLDQVLNALNFLQFAALTLALPLLFGLATGARRLRGVAPIVFAGLLVFGLGPMLGLRLTQWLSGTRAGTEWVLSGPGTDTGFVLLALPMGLIAWWRLRSLARGYEAKRFSELMLLAQTWWLMMVVLDAVDLVNAQSVRVLWPVLGASVLSAALFRLLLPRALRRAVPAPRPQARTLLLLRVFGDTARSEALFDRLVARWRWFGPVTMIAAPDVVARTVDPGDFLQFVSGHIGASFVNTQAELDQRLATLDLSPDPDGRFRINEFCCRDSSWQATVVQLIERADAVVMDLRGFNAQRAGCAFELGELARRRRPQQVVLLVDASTDRARLEPWLGPPETRPTMIELPKSDRQALQRAFEGLLRAAGVAS